MAHTPWYEVQEGDDTPVEAWTVERRLVEIKLELEEVYRQVESALEQIRKIQ